MTTNKCSEKYKNVVKGKYKVAYYKVVLLKYLKILIVLIYLVPPLNLYVDQLLDIYNLGICICAV